MDSESPSSSSSRVLPFLSFGVLISVSPGFPVELWQSFTLLREVLETPQSSAASTSETQELLFSRLREALVDCLFWLPSFVK